jgi:preprotein translocase subunit SecA
LKATEIELTGKVYKEALKYYTEKRNVAQEKLFHHQEYIRRKKNQFERIVVPFTDGVKS